MGNIIYLARKDDPHQVGVYLELVSEDSTHWRGYSYSGAPTEFEKADYIIVQAT